MAAFWQALSPHLPSAMMGSALLSPIIARANKDLTRRNAWVLFVLFFGGGLLLAALR